MILNKPNKYEEVQVNLDFEKLEVGGHKGIIKDVTEYTSEVSGKTSLKVEVDTASDDKQPNFYQKQYNENTNMDKKWSSAATKYVPIGSEENQIKLLKAFITAVENSNPNFTYDWSKDINQLKGKKVGLVFGLEEYTKQDGTIGLATKLNQFRSIDKVDNAKIPKVKLIDGSLIEYEIYNSRKDNTTTSSDSFADSDVVEITDDILD